jgi:hypothetical protein
MILAPKRPLDRQFTHWWNEDCADKKKNCISTAKFARRHPTSIANRERKTKQDEYKNSIYAAKKNSWPKFIKEVNSLPEMSRVNKIMRSTGARAAELGLVKDSQGNLDDSKQDSLQLMLAKHFPDSTPTEAVLEQEYRMNPMNPHLCCECHGSQRKDSEER